MDINQLLEQAKQRGLSALDSIRKSVAPPTTYTPQPIYKPVAQSFSKITSTSLPSIVSRPLQIKPVPLAPKKTETTQNFLTSIEALPGDVNKRLIFQFNKYSNELQDALKTNVAPALNKYIETYNRTGLEITPLDVALAPKDKRKELITKLGEQQSALAPVQAQTGLAGFQAITPNIVNKAIIQPTYQQFQLNLRQQETGQVATQEELNAANMGELNRTTNDLLNKKVIDITPNMSFDQQTKAALNNQIYYRNEVKDTVVSLLDIDTLLGGAKIAKEGVEALVKKGIKSVSPDITEKLVAKEAKITQAIIENDIPKIEAEINKTLKPEQISKIQEINNLPIDNTFKKSIAEASTIQTNFKTQVQEVNNAVKERFNKTIEDLKPKIDENTSFNREYNKAREVERTVAAGKNNLKQTAEATWYDIVGAFYSRRAIVNDTIDKLVKSGVELMPSKDPRNLAHAMNNTGIQTDMILKDLGYWDSIKEAVDANTGILKKKEVPGDFGNFLAARRKTTLADANIQSNPNYVEDAKFVVNNTPKYRVAAEKFDAFVSKFVDELVNANLISIEKANQIKKNKDYAPFKVVVNDIVEKRKLKLTEKKLDVSKDVVVKQLQDFESNIVENPLETMQSLVAAYVNEKARNNYARSFGELIRQGLIPDAYIIRDAKNVKLREYYNSTIENIKDTTDKLEKIFKRDKKATNKVFREVNNLNKAGYNAVTFQKTSQEESKFAQSVSRAIERRLDKREGFLTDIENIFQDVLKTKESGEIVLKDQKFLNKTNRMIDTRNDWLQDLVTLGADTLGKKPKKQMAEGVKIASLNARKEFIQNATQQDVFNYIYDIYNLPYEDFKKLYTKAESQKLKIISVLKDIQDIKNARTTNILVNSIVSMPQPQIEKLIGKIGKKESDIGQLMREIRTLDLNRYKNNLVNSLIKNSPEELAGIQAKIQKKSPILNEMIDNILAQQNTIDINRGIAKQLQEEEKAIRDLPKQGLTTISWLGDNGVTEIAAIPKQMERAFLEDMSISAFYGTPVFKAIESSTNGFFKTVLTGINPVSKTKQLKKQATQLATIVEKDLILGAINPLDFTKAMRDVYMETPEYKKFVEVGGGYSRFNFGRAGTDISRFAKNGGNIKKVKFSDLEKIAGLDEEASRFQIFNLYKNKYLKDGLSELDASYKAINDVNRVLPNYGEQGTYTRLIEAMYPFFRINLQSATVWGREFKKNPAGTLFKLSTRVGVPAILSTAYNNATPEQRIAYNDLTEDQKSKGIIIVPRNPKKDENGKWIVYELPVEEAVMNFYNPFRRAVEAGINGGENWMFAMAQSIISPESLSNYIQGTTGINIPTSGKKFEQGVFGQMNPLLRGPIELAANKQFYTGQPIVPQNLQSINDPFMQYDEKTTPLAKELGYRLNFSPKRVDYFMQNLSVGVLDYAEMAVNQALQEAENSKVKQATGVNPVQQLIDQILFVKKVGVQQDKKFMKK